MAACRYCLGLFVITDDPAEPATAVTGGYGDLLRDEDIGGIGVTD